ncbi:hypothetical protein COY60_04300 [Candidatus Gracilibacteria bacterium CG_4_10_14_0_8_um_filter_38_28]|nr:MAG: hypothetical protein COY60_04300 [Candidatus Gracilibacteria bacterium CG_4_10_14_0_8_um_filter_38_28]
MNNVVDFVARVGTTQKTLNSSLVQEQNSAKIYNLTKPEPKFHFYSERLIAGDIHIQEFFQVLLESGAVTIINLGEEINLKSLLRVEKEPNDIYEIGVDDFIRFTESKSGIVSDNNIEAYLIPMLGSIGMQIGMITEDEDTFTESVMTKEDVEIFHAETIKAVWEDGFYSCLVDNKDGKGEYFTVDNFESPMEMPLLYLLCQAYEEYFGSGCILDEEQIKIELASYEGIYTHTRFVSISLLQEIILSAIERKNPIYNNYSPDKRIKMFYDKIVYPLLSEEYLNGEFEEE